jgi:hypothetical protein
MRRLPVRLCGPHLARLGTGRRAAPDRQGQAPHFAPRGPGCARAAEHLGGLPADVAAKIAAVLRNEQRAQGPPARGAPGMTTQSDHNSDAQTPNLAQRQGKPGPRPRSGPRRVRETALPTTAGSAVGEVTMTATAHGPHHEENPHDT